jgi:2,4-dienoyl-CoA reductase-like NADH-dependent reductase (Old Yellow Enzyme family)
MSLGEFRAHLARVAPEVPCDEEILRAERSPLAAPLAAGALRAGNRWVVQPMEGWDGTAGGQPGPHTIRRWENFGRSGAKLVWGGEAVAVRADGRANPSQLVLAPENTESLAALRRALVAAHTARFGGAGGLVVGLQLTHSGRFARPRAHDRPEPRVAFRHPLLDGRSAVTSERQVLSDAEVEGLIGDFAAAARRAREAGFDFVDVKACHGYLLHEFLAAHTRPGPYGGPFENRVRLLRSIIEAIRREAPGLEIGVRASIFDVVPYRRGADGASESGGARGPGSGSARGLGTGVPEDFSSCLPYRFGFGVNPSDPTAPDLEEGRRLLALLGSLGIALVNLSAGSPYYNPHVQRPALYPPSDGYQPPEDPLAGVARQLRAARDLKREFPDLVIIGSAFSYLQDYLPHVAQAVVREGWMDAVGLGRVMLSYWDLPADVLEKGALERRRLCRTFSDCTSAPRNGLVSGCYPLDGYYGALPEAAALRRLKRG